MSKRFGRNQRRRMREQISLMSQAIERDQHAIAEARFFSDRLRSEMDRARSCVAHYSFVMNPRSIRVNRTPSDYGEFIELDRPLLLSPTDHRSDGQRDVREHMMRESLPVMISKSGIDRSTGDLHVRVRYMDGHWGYAVSREAFLHTHFDVMVRTIAEELAFAITTEVRNKGLKP